MINPNKNFLIIVSVSLLFSCKKSEERTCFKSNGKIATEERSAKSFHTIELNDKINLILKQDTVHKITVVAPSNLIHLVETDITDNILIINNKNRCDFLRSYQYEINVYVSVVHLSNIYFTGAGKITSVNTIESPKITFDFWNTSGSLNITLKAEASHCNMHAGAGDMTISGFSGVSYVYGAGTGFMYLQNLITAYSYVRNNGTGDFYINAEKELGVVITSLGSVFYKGNPSITSEEISGKGKLQKRD